MKLLVFSHYYPPHIGGVENYVEELCSHLGDKGVSTTVFTPHLPTGSPARESLPRMDIIRFPAFEIVPNYPLPKCWDPAFWKSYAALFHTPFDIVVSNTRFFNTSLMALRYAGRKKIPWVHIEHGSAFVELSNGLTTSLSRLYDLTLGRLVLRSSTRNVAISRAVADFIGRFDDRTPTVIYRGLDLDTIDAAPTNLELAKTYEGKLIIAFAGRLSKWKGIEESVRAVSGLPREIKDRVIFLIAGDGEDAERIRGLADDATIMLGGLPRERVFGFLKATDVFIHSAVPGGGLSTSLLEAMYCGCAIIATPNEGAREVIVDRENGLLIDRSDSALIREKIVELLEHPEDRKRYAENARRTVRESFDWNTNAGTYAAFFEDLLRKYPSR